MKKKLTLMLLLALLVCTVPVIARSSAPRNGKYIDKNGNIFIMRHGKPRTGYFRYKGKTYYGHKTSTRKYPKGSVTTGEMRIRSGNRWYAFGTDGARIEKDTYIRKNRVRKLPELDIRSRNKTVRYVYGTSRATLGTRYSTRLRRMQMLFDNGKWYDYEGMQYLPDYVDEQR